MRPERAPDFVICPHCWHLNGPLSRIFMKCRADMSLMLQESGGGQWTAAVQSPVPIERAERLKRSQRAFLLGLVILFGLAQLLFAFAPSVAMQRGEVSAPMDR